MTAVAEAVLAVIGALCVSATAGVLLLLGLVAASERSARERAVRRAVRGIDGDYRELAQEQQRGGGAS